MDTTMIKGLLNNVLVDAWCLNKGGLNLYLIHPFLLRSKKLGEKNTHKARESKTGFWSALLLTQHHQQQAVCMPTRGGRNGHWETGQLAPQGNAIWQTGKYYGGKHVWYIYGGYDGCHEKLYSVMISTHTYAFGDAITCPFIYAVKSALQTEQWLMDVVVNHTARKPQHRLPSSPFLDSARFSYLLPRRRNSIDRVTTYARPKSSYYYGYISIQLQLIRPTDASICRAMSPFQKRPLRIQSFFY
jgi:hypothetical protein